MAIGVYTAVTVTITGSMAGRSGDGVASAELVSTGTGCASSIAITRVIGGTSGRTGICGGAITTTNDQDGSGQTATSVLVVTSTDTSCIADGLALAG